MVATFPHFFFMKLFARRVGLGRDLFFGMGTENLEKNLPRWQVVAGRTQTRGLTCIIVEPFTCYRKQLKETKKQDCTKNIAYISPPSNIASFGMAHMHGHYRVLAASLLS